jgi:hypothetical protein
VGWTTALAALGVSTALVAFGVWLVRLPLAEFILGAALSQRGVDADFDVIALGLEHTTIANIVVGAEEAPDAAVAVVEAHWVWEGLTPRITSVRVVEPRVQLTVTSSGDLTVDAIDGLRTEGRARRASIPPIELEIVDGQALLQAPFGSIPATFSSTGRIGEDFRGEAAIAPTSRENGAYALNDAEAALVATSIGESIDLTMSARVGALAWNNAHVDSASLAATATASLDLAHIEAQAQWIVGQVAAPGVEASALTGRAEARGDMSADGLSFETWSASFNGGAQTLAAAEAQLADAAVSATARGLAGAGSLTWRFSGARFSGFAMLARDVRAGGALQFHLSDSVSATGDANVSLGGAALDGDAQAQLRAAIPNADGSPIGPTLASAEAALDRAADAFDVTALLGLAVDGDAVRVTLSRPVQVRAQSGASLRMSPLRQDAPMLTASWPGAILGGAMSLELSGGGAPRAALLLDRIAHAPEEPFSADGTLSLSDWRAGDASIAIEEMDVSISIADDGDGRLELDGPAHVTGPLGDGSLRDLVAGVDVAVTWGRTWQVTPNGCLPVRMGQLDAAGLSFSHGDFALCTLDGALIAADARGALSGGFSVQRLALSGRMSGPEGQPALLNVANVMGRFSGRGGNIELAITAAAPRLAIEMAEDRTLTLALSRATANASIADSWRVDGTFSEGALSDPALPGTVSAIAGRWSAAPGESGDAVVRVTAGEALLTANRPATEAELPLFNPLRLANMAAQVSDGAIIAEGDLLLDETSAELAHFAAQHLISEGTGRAEIAADRISFTSDGLQPYDISEQARGLVENVRGDIGASADIVWTNDTLTSTGRVRLDGVSLATSTIPIVGDVRGEIYFDDLFMLTTPPGQVVSVGELNPGLAVQDGVVRFQLLPEQRVSIEDASFVFASGRLAMSPTVITLGSEETRFELTLRDVDAATLIATLGIPDLAATGHVEGSFPLLLTRRTAFIENGVLRAQPGGGVIAYTGSAGDAATGPARLAFDALRRFRYDALQLTLNGDLNGEVVSAITFSGENASDDVELGDIAPMPGVGDVVLRGVPFDFNVTVSAPFRALAQTAASITDPASLLNLQGNRPGDEGDHGQTQQSVDPPGSNPR